MRPSVLILILVLVPEVLRPQARLSREEALRVCFPAPLQIERRTLFLTDRQVQEIQSRARTNVESKLVTYYAGVDARVVRGVAFLETHVVRTMPETFVVHLDPGGAIRWVEMLAFHEPEDYRPSERWLGQLAGRRLDDDLWLKRGVQTIVGATLTSQAIVSRVRRILATYEVALQEGR